MGNGYWEKRYLKDKAAMINRSEKYIEEQQRKYYVQAQKEIREDIESLYQKFADKEKITLAEAKRQISRADFAKIDFEKMVDYQIEQNQEFRKKKGTLPGDVIAAIEKQHARYETGLRAYTKKGQITRLELLDLQIDKALLDLYDKNQISMYDCLARIYEDGYYRSIFAGQKAIRFGKDFAVPNTRAVERAVLNTYNKKGYSKRLYEHCNAFSKDLKENLVTGFIKGESIDKMSARISRRLNVSEANARRLVRTETAYVYEQASLQAYQACGIEMYEFMAMLDHKTSPPCQALDGKRFLIKDAVPGKNYPPMHPNCRSTTVAAFEDDKVTKRLAKDERGKYYEVPSDMTYPEWKKKYMDGGSRNARLQETPSDAIIRKKDPLMKNLPVLSAIKTNEDLKAFAEQFIDNLGIDRSNINVQVKGMLEKGGCKINTLQPELLKTCRYDEYILQANDDRPMEYRIKTAFHESFHLNLNGREWDAVNKKYEKNAYWDEIEETFAEVSSHYMLERYGITKKLAPAYPDKIVKNLPRLKQLEEFSGCNTIQDFGRVAFGTRQNGGNGNWKQMYNRMRKIKIDSKYDIQYFDYVKKHEDELFKMACENVTGMENFKENIMDELHKEMSFVENTGMVPAADSVYYWFMSCAMQLEGVK